jgi:hypothetical protein
LRDKGLGASVEKNELPIEIGLEPVGDQRPGPCPKRPRNMGNWGLTPIHPSNSPLDCHTTSAGREPRFCVLDCVDNQSDNLMVRLCQYAVVAADETSGCRLVWHPRCARPTFPRYPLPSDMLIR